MKFLPLFALAAIVLAGCKGGVANDPKAVLSEFFSRMAKKDIDGAAKLTTKDSKSTMDMMKKGMEMAEKMKKDMPKDEEDPAEKFKGMEMGDAKIEGDMATVECKQKGSSESTSFQLKKEDGSWKVDFSMATLMKMGDKGGMNSDMNGGSDSLSNPSEELKDYNPDDVKKGLEAADSMLKTIDPEKLKEAQKAIEEMKKQQ